MKGKIHVHGLHFDRSALARMPPPALVGAYAVALHRAYARLGGNDAVERSGESGEPEVLVSL